MIILQNLKWSNWFSYGEDNYIDFQNSNLTQILGQNGSGKTSIIHILEEILFNKNSKGVKKADIMNREYNFLTATLEFSVDNTGYMIKLDRKSSAKVSLFDLTNDMDISSHTATNTFKDIQKIIGMDFSTFSQLVYQNSKQGLEFLTSADSARKKFLISLFNLDKYTNYYDIFKKAFNDVNLTVKECEGKKSVLQKWLDTHSNIDFNLKILADEPSDDEIHSIILEISKLQDNIDNIEAENLKIDKNNRAIEYFECMYVPKIVPDMPTLHSNVEATMIALNKYISEDNKFIRELNKLGDSECSTCYQTIDTSIKDKMIESSKVRMGKHKDHLAKLNGEVEQHKLALSEYKKLKSASDMYELAKSKIDTSIRTDLFRKEGLSSEIDSLNDNVKTLKANRIAILKKNREATAHNSKVETLIKELDRTSRDLQRVDEALDEAGGIKTKLDILKTIFSTKGLVSYKIDFLIKDLQSKINEYLVVLSDGRFQLNFILKSESINIGIIDNGNNVDISALSTGELSRVNVSTLLAIRALMSSLSNTKVNLLFLDEILGVLDEQGKANLIDILLEEKDLNTYIVSHEYTHPLLDKLYVSKTKEGSKIG